MKQFFCFNHQNKASAYINALTTRGWTLTKDPGKASFILSDSDVLVRFKTLKEYAKRGVKVFLYPHAGPPNNFWDFPGTVYSDFVTAHFVPAQGHIDIMRAYGNPYTLHAVGWHLCPVRPFRPRKVARRIVFAPIHPNSNGFLCKLDRSLNIAAFQKLLPLISEEVSLVVRHVGGDLKQNGLWRAGGVEYVEGQKDQSHLEIDRADLVVGHQTFPYLAVARGTPTLMMGEWYPTRWGGTEEALTHAATWDKYKDLLMYPLDLLSDTETSALIERAIRSDPEVADWKRRLIGETFQPDPFVDLVESYL